MKWFPWSWVVRRAARSFGFIDPLLVLARVRRFGQPSEHDLPLEILRTAVVFHARGLVNTRAIQNNLDWIWPYWIERQFDPRDVSFLPRSANISHINLTHRNWTAVGLPDLDVYPLVDPRGLITPFHDSWSIDAWIIAQEGQSLIPSQLLEARQALCALDQSITTETAQLHIRLTSTVRVLIQEGTPVLRVDYVAESERAADLVVSIRPYNPEGIQFVDKLEALAERNGWRVNGEQRVRFSEAPERLLHSTYAEGDVVHRLALETQPGIECPVGMATGAACFAIVPGQSRAVSVLIPLPREAQRQRSGTKWRATSWDATRAGLASLSVPDIRYQSIFDSALNTLLLLSADEVYPGPYTYRRFWFRDASLMLEALVQLGGVARVKEKLGTFAARQRPDGYFESQEGEWDANGQVLWVLGRYLALTGEGLPKEWVRSITQAIRWLERRQLPLNGQPQAGLLPAGFSAEHFGPNDHYYWDVFWAIGGLRAIAPALARAGLSVESNACRSLAQRYFDAVEQSIERFALARGRGAIPASPFRRMDSGAIGVLVADYPLQLYRADEPRLHRTLDYFLTHNFVNGGFFQDMTHSGVNAYLTLALAQSLLRAGRTGWEKIVLQMQADASPTGVWPEAIHPQTFGGCIGDGHHGWAAAEWLRWTRNAFVREEGDTLILGSGLMPKWLSAREPMTFGPTLTPWGPVRVQVMPVERTLWEVRLEAQWRQAAPNIVVQIPGAKAQPLVSNSIRIAVAA